MTNNDLIQLASLRLYTHFVKLYFPEELETPNPEDPTVKEQKSAHFGLIIFLKSGGLIQDRYRSFMFACDKLEIDYLCLGKSKPDIKDETSVLFSESEKAFRLIDRHSKAGS